MRFEKFKELVHDLANRLEESSSVGFEEVEGDEPFVAVITIEYYADLFQVPVFEKEDGEGIGVGQDPDFLGGGDVESIFMYLFNESYFSHCETLDFLKSGNFNATNYAMSNNLEIPVNLDVLDSIWELVDKYYLAQGS